MKLDKRISELIETVEDDQELAVELHKLSEEHLWEFQRLVASWGPKLYERNHVVFLPLIERNIDSWIAQQTADLEGWLHQADAHGYTSLYRTLLQAWLNKEYGWGEAANKWEEMFLAAFRAAESRADRRDVVDKFNLWYDITDELGVALYRVDPVVTANFVTQRLDRLEWFDIVYEDLARVALESGDRDFYFALYRRTFTQQMWEKDVAELLANVADPHKLCEELDRRHLAGDESMLTAEAYLKVLRARGEDVLPYVLKRIPNAWSWGHVEKAWNEILAMAEKNSWWHLWTTVVRTQSNQATFTQTVQRLLDSDWPEWHVAALLGQIAGATYGWREWQQPCPLEEKTSIALYQRFPEFVRGPYARHLVLTRTWNAKKSAWEETRMLELAQLAVSEDDHAIVDILAAKAVNEYGNLWQREAPTGLGWYVQYFSRLGDDAFAERAFGVMERLEPFEFLGREQRRSLNDLYAIFFDEPRRYRSKADQVVDLFESANEDVQRLGLRILSHADRRIAVRTAEQAIDHLLAFLLNECLRATRIEAFACLALAAEASEESARRIHDRAREALRLRRRHYPRERLVELVGKLIHRWPSLRQPSEEPVVYDHAEAS